MPGLGSVLCADSPFKSNIPWRSARHDILDAERAACVAKALRSKVLDFGLGSDMLC